MKGLNKTRLVSSILFLFIGIMSVFAISNLLHTEPVPDALGDSVSLSNIPNQAIDSEVLGEKDENPIFFTVNVPSRFKKDISAPNIVYSITGGEGVEVTEGQSPTISNAGVLSLQNQTGDLALVAGNGIVINGLAITNSRGFIGAGGVTITEAANGTITVSSEAPDYTLSGWTKVGSTVVLTTVSDLVTVDAITFGNATVTNGKSIRPDTDLGSDLGSAAFRFNNLYVGNINSNSSTSTAGQATFTYEALSIALTEASVLINPTAPVANGQLLGLSVAGYQRALIDEDGDLTLGYNDAISAPASDYPLSVYGHNGTNVSFINTSGDAYFAGNVGIGTDAPQNTLHISSAAARPLRIEREGGSYDPWEWGLDDTGMYFRSVLTSRVPLSLTENGDVGIFTATPTAKLHIVGYEDNEQLIIQGSATQTLNLQEWQNSAGTVLSGVDERGILFSHGGTDPTNFFGGGSSGNTTLTGGKNNALGYQALANNTSGSYNNAFGYQALFKTTGSSNNAMGYRTMYENTSGSQNIAFGNYALRYNTSGVGNQALGLYALHYSQTGTYNIGLGYQSGGYGTGISFTGADYNTILGYQAGYNLNTDMDRNVYIGYQAGYDATGSDQLYIDNSSSASPLIWGDFANDVLAITGDVGIGTQSPYAYDTTSTMLHIKAGGSYLKELARFEGGADSVPGSGGVIRIGTSNDRGIYIEGGKNPAALIYGAIGTTESDGSKTENIYLLNNGNVGIGTTTPSGNLTVKSSAYGATPLRIENSNGALIFSIFNGTGAGGGGGMIQLRDASLNEAIRLTSDGGDSWFNSGDVGIGTDSPSTSLQLGGDTNDISSGITFNDGVTGLYEAYGSLNIKAFAGGSISLQSDGLVGSAGSTSFKLALAPNSSTTPIFIPNKADFNTGIGWASDDTLSLIAGGVNGLNVDGVGQIGIGTTSPGAKLDIRNNANDDALTITANATQSNPILRIFESNGTTESVRFYPGKGGASAGAAYAFDTTDTQTAGYLFILNNNASSKLAIDYAGNMGIKDVTPSYSLDVTGMMRATEGVVTYTKAGTISDVDFTETPIDGLMGVDSTNGRLYFRHGGAWHYVAQTAGFQIPEYETYTYDFNTSSFDTSTPLADGDFLIPFVEGRMSDGAVHGLYTSFSDVKDQLFADELSRILSLEQRVTALEAGGGLSTNPLLSSTGSIGTVAGWSDTQWTFLGSVILPTDTAGNTTVATGTDEIVVTFTRPYTSTPVVTANITTDSASAQTIADLGISYVIANTTTNGFSIVLSEPAPMNIDFSWVAILTQ